jgi:polyisoprenoid-binding protein YceI
MTKSTLALLFFIAAASLPTFAEEVGLDAHVSLSPAGSFEAKTKEVKGTATVDGKTVSAKDIKVDLTTVTTGISLRDKHTQKHMETDKYPQAELLNAKGVDGKGEGTIKFHGVEKKVAGTFNVTDGKLIAEFPIKLSEFGITGIRYAGAGVKDEVKVRIVVPASKAVK